MRKTLIAALTAASMLLGGAAVQAQMAPFGTEEDTAYAAALWDLMVAANLAGDDAIRTIPYEGVDPHGKMLETFFTSATIDGHEGSLVIKRNYGPEGVEADQVLSNPAKHLGAITVMFQREDGFDDENQNWFWAKFLPDGSLDKNAKGMQLAGRVAKGADQGCIACHANAPGEDYLFTADALSSDPKMNMN